MPGVGVGGLISNLVNPGLDDQIGAAVTPNPNPLAQQGQPAAATSGSPNMPNAAATKQDPVSANLASLLLKRQHQAELAADFNQNIQGVAAGFGTAQQQASKQAALHGGGGAGGGIGDVGDIMKIQQAVTDQNEHARLMANAGVFASALRDHGINVTDEQATVLMNSPKFMDTMGSAFGSNVTQSAQVKDYNTAKDDLTASMKRANPTMSDADIAAAVDKRMPPDLLLSSVGGNPEDAAYYQYASLERAAGRTPLDPLAWKEQHTVKATEDITRTKDATEFKDQAIQDVDKVNEKLTTSEGVVDRLLKDIPATMTALKTPDQLTSGQGIAIAKDLPLVGGLVKSFIAPTDATTALAADIRTLKSGLAASALTDVKNVRNRQEFDAIGRSLTAGLDAANSPEAVRRVLEETKQRFAVARINAKAAAGRELSPDEAPLANPDYLNPTLDNGDKNPYFTGATVAKSPAPKPEAPVKRRHYNEKGELVDQ